MNKIENLKKKNQKKKSKKQINLKS